MTSTVRRLAALSALALALPLSLPAQMQGNRAPTLASTAPIATTTTVAESRSRLTDALVAEWDAAYRLQARRDCAFGERNPAVVMVSMTGVLMQSQTVPDSERDTVSKAIYNAWSEVYAAGGCPGLDAPPYQVITALGGTRWLSPASAMSAEALSGRATAYGHDVSRRWTYDGTSGEARVSGAEDRFATSRQSCASDMMRVAVEIGANHQGLTTRRGFQVGGALPTDPDARVCGAFLAAPAGTASWTIDFLNPKTQALEAAVVLQRGEGETMEIVVRYPGSAAQ